MHDRGTVDGAGVVHTIDVTDKTMVTNTIDVTDTTVAFGVIIGARNQTVDGFDLARRDRRHRLDM